MFEVSPAEVQPGAPFQVIVPADTSIGVDLVLRRGDEPLYVFHGHSGPDGAVGAERVQDGMVITHPALILSDGEERIIDIKLPDDVEPGQVRICSEDDCTGFQVTEP